MLQAVIAVANFIFGWFAWSRWRMGIFYAVLDLNLVTMCQYGLSYYHLG